MEIDKLIDQILIEISKTDTYIKTKSESFDNIMDYYKYHVAFMCMIQDSRLIFKPVSNAGYFYLTLYGRQVINEGGWLNHLENNKIEAKKLSDKSSLDLHLTKLQKKTFWLVFGFGIFGGIYSIYDAINSKAIDTKFEKMEMRILKLEEEISKSHTLPLCQKNTDSLIVRKVENSTLRN